MKRAILALALTAATLPAMADSGQIELNTAGQFQRLPVSYNCAADGPLDVTYINAAPNYLAIVPVSGEAEDLVFSAVLSGSGTRYAAGKWAWWSTGNTASLYDTTLDANAPPVLTCTQISSSS